jgi:hypothetical protein
MQPGGLAERVLNQKTPFNPHAAEVRELVPFFIIVE